MLPILTKPRIQYGVEEAFEAGIIERYGSGIARIQNECEKHGKVTVEFVEFQHGFKITLTKMEANNSVGVNEGVNSLYALVQKYPNKKTPFFAQELDTSIKNIERWIKQLKEGTTKQYAF